MYKAAQRGTREIINLHSLTLHHAILICILGLSPSIHVRYVFYSDSQLLKLKVAFVPLQYCELLTACNPLKPSFFGEK